MVNENRMQIEYNLNGDDVKRYNEMCSKKVFC